MKCAAKYEGHYIINWDKEHRQITHSWDVDRAHCFNSINEAIAELPPYFKYSFVNWKTIERKQKAKYIISVNGTERFVEKRTKCKIRTTYSAKYALRFCTLKSAEDYIKKLHPADKTIKFYVVERSKYEQTN